MKIAIHHRQGSFSDRWINYCKKKNIDYKIVNAFDSNIIEQLSDCDGLMWHHHHANYKDVLTAKRILFALEHAGIRVFPDFKTGWHFDDKVAQKYLFEALDIPRVPSFVFYDKLKALEWAEKVTYPKVFKLKGGAGAANVKLVRTYNQAIALINQAFGKGFRQFDRINYIKDRFFKFKSGKESLTSFLRSLARIFITPDFAKNQPSEKGYIYFQEFIPDNDYDIRVIIVGNKAFAIKRMVRENDFRASGSGNIIYDQKEIDKEIIKLAFKINEKIGSSSIAFDFIFYKNNKPLIVEISYGYSVNAYNECQGYWDKDLKWYAGNFNPQEWMVEDLIKSIKSL